MPVLVGPTITVRDLKQRAVQQGCVLRTTRAAILVDGVHRNVPYLHNPKTNGRYPLHDLADDDTILGYEIGLIARRLSIILP